jgi:queuosine precursor transporter
MPSEAIGSAMAEQTTVIREDRRRLIEGAVSLILFGLTIPAANWMILHVGTVCPPQSPCLVPVAPGLLAPSGVIMIGLALVLRDVVQRRLGLAAALAAVLAGAALSAAVAPPAIVVASAAAFLLSETADLLVYTPLQRRGFVRAVVLSSLVGLVVDSAVFLYLAFGSLEFLAGQIVGKAWMVLLALPLVHWLRQRDRRLGLAPA